MDRPFIVENKKALERLRSLVGRLTDEELTIPLGSGWTIAVALAHLSFWDQRSFLLMRKWRKSGVAPSPIDIDITNDSLLSLWQALPPRKAANLAISSAEAIDRELEDASSEFITEIGNLGEKFRFYRCIHRQLHLDEIEECISNKNTT